MLAEGKYKDLLIKFGQNGNYSVSNMLYLLSQNPDITVVKGMNEWERAGRHIKEGAKSMEIMAPTKVKYNVKVISRAHGVGGARRLFIRFGITSSSTLRTARLYRLCSATRPMKRRERARRKSLSAGTSIAAWW